MKSFPRTRRGPTPTWLRPGGGVLLPFSMWLALWAVPVLLRAGTPAGSPASTPVYTLDECLAVARKQNPEILAASKRIDATRANIITAKAGIFPTLSASGYYQYREQNLANGGDGEQTQVVNGKTIEVNGQATNRKEDYVADARLSQNLYSAGAVRNRIAATKLLTELETLNYQAQVDTTTLAVRVAFFQTLFAEGRIGVAQQAVDLLAAQLKDQQDRLAAGSVGQVNVNRAQVTLTNEQPSLFEAQASLRTSYVTLGQLLAVSYPENSVAQPFRIRGALDTPPLRMTLAECLGRAKAMRPEIRARKLFLDVLQRNLVIEKSATRPQISGFVAYDVFSEPSILSTRDNFSGYTVGLQASWTIFDGFATRGRVRGVQAQQGEAEAQLASIRQQVEAEVRSAFYDLQQAKETLRPQTETIRLATENLDLTTHNFDAGLSTTQLDVLQSRVDLTRSRLTELTGRLAYRSALARLERAMGMGRPLEGSATDLPATNK